MNTAQTVPTPTLPYADDPIYEQDIVAGTSVLRATVDVADGTLWSCLVVEPETGPLQQAYCPMTRARWIALATICASALAALDRHGNAQAARCGSGFHESL